MGKNAPPMTEFDERPRRPHNKLDINYIPSSKGAPTLGITSKEGYDAMLAKMRLHDPQFCVSHVPLNPPHTHKARMKQINFAINYIACLMVPRREPREWSLADYTYTAVRAASYSWPDGVPVVLFACRPGDRSRYPVFAEIDELKARIERKKKMTLECLAAVDVDGEKLEQLKEEKKKLEVALKTLEQDAEMIAVLTWAKTGLRCDEPRHVFTDRNAAG